MENITITDIESVTTKAVINELTGEFATKETMAQLSDFEKLDFVLCYMLLNKHIFNHIALLTAINHRIGDIELISTLQRLENDGYVLERDTDEALSARERHDNHYDVTTKGTEFILNGGYTKK